MSEVRGQKSEVRKTTVVNVRTDAFDVYIGRGVRGWDPRTHEESPFANPFVMGRDGTREQVIAKYREHLLNCLEQDPATWIPRLRALKGKRLGCWCAPLACHGHTVAEFADMQLVEDE